MITVMSSDLHVVRAGRGTRLLLIHGTAADHTTWQIQLFSSLRDRFAMIAYDRRSDGESVEQHAADAAALLAREGGPAIVVGSSFGAVVALELLRTHPTLVRGAILIEPPMPASEELAKATAYFLSEFDRRVAAHGGPAAGEFFLRTVLGDATLERMPKAFQDRATSRWSEIRADSTAQIAYKPRYDELSAVTVPVLLLGGERSPTYFRETLDLLERSLPNVRRELVVGAGHMLHAEAPRKFAELLVQFADQLQIE
jgi:pimeloyl-ACP methyl ester carboxylesterase